MDNNEDFEIESIGTTYYASSFSFEEECERAFDGDDNFYFRSKNAKFNFWAMFFGPYYYFYRKMLLIGAVLCIIVTLIPFPMEIMLVVWLVEGLIFYPLYRFDRKRKIDKVLRTFGDRPKDEQLQMIRHTGGKSSLMVLGALLGIHFVSFLLSLFI